MANKHKMKTSYFILLMGVGLMIYSSKLAAPRGIRNNNPGNIRHGDNWRGMRERQTDKSFVQFVEAKYGIRAMTRILDNYAKRGLNTVEEIISSWAPPVENNTQSYIKSVLITANWAPGHLVKKGDGDYLPLIKAIIKHENGTNPYSDTVINEGIAIA